MEHGYRVEATDGSAELCKLAAHILEFSVKYMLFQGVGRAEKKYDGIWACSSILHCQRMNLKMLCSEDVVCIEG